MSQSTELVALRLRSGRDLVTQLLRSWEDGMAALPLDPGLPQPAVAALIDLLRPSRLIDDSGEQALDGVPVESGTALVIPTSGATGVPKGVQLSHAALEWSARAYVAAIGHPTGRWLCCLPLHHIAGLMVVLRSRLHGTQAAIHDRFDERAIDEETDVDLISLVPAMLERLLDHGSDLSRYSAVLLGGGPVPGALVERALSSGARIVATYGMTETCGGCVLDGRPLDGVGLKIREERILISGPMLFSGYRLRPESSGAALREGWFHTSDRGRILGDGRLEVLGRLDDLIITGGKKVSPGEVEAILAAHPSIKEAAVTGLPSEGWGQDIAAALVVEPGNRIDLGELRDFVSSRAARWMAPKRIVEVEALPKSATGKVPRAEVQRLFEPSPPALDG